MLFTVFLVQCSFHPNIVSLSKCLLHFTSDLLFKKPCLPLVLFYLKSNAKKTLRLHSYHRSSWQHSSPPTTSFNPTLTSCRWFLHTPWKTEGNRKITIMKVFMFLGLLSNQFTCLSIIILYCEYISCPVIDIHVVSTVFNFDINRETSLALSGVKVFRIKSCGKNNRRKLFIETCSPLVAFFNTTINWNYFKLFSSIATDFSCFQKRPCGEKKKTIILPALCYFITSRISLSSDTFFNLRWWHYCVLLRHQSITSTILMV